MFSYLTAILHTKEKIVLNCDDESQFSLFMINRWLSFYNAPIANVINETTNRLNFAPLLKQEQLDLLSNIIPALPRRHIKYIKKTKKTAAPNAEEDGPVVPEFTSERRYKQQLELLETLNKYEHDKSIN